MESLFFYTEHFTPRVQYVLDILEERWGVKIQKITFWTEFSEIEKPKMNYSNQWDDNSVQIKPHGLLTEKDIHSFDFNTLEYDPLAMIFFLISRYEEYVVKERDAHGRFSAKSSFLHQTNRLQKPWADILIEDLKTQIQTKFPEVKFKPNSFQSEFTIDIDQAFCYRGKSFKRFIGANVRDALRFDFEGIIDRKLSYFHLKKDPWDIFSDLKELAKHKTTQPHVFFLVGDYSKFNKNLSHQNSDFQKIIQSAEAWAKVGLHPSYNAGENSNQIQKEKKRLEDILSKNVTDSRQHYIQLSIPKTYRNLLMAEISDDYTMGFADDIGFRAGTAFPFDWYDLEKEETTNLKVHPFSAMDVTLKNYLKLNPKEAEKELENLKQEVKNVGGIFSIVCHNESLSDYREWKGWSELLLNYWK